MNAVEQQMELPIPAELKAIPEADWHRLGSEGEAVKYACERTGRLNKEIAYKIGTDETTLSNAKSDKARLPAHVRRALAEFSGVPATLYFECLLHNFDPRSLRPLESAMSRENRKLREELERLRYEREIEQRTVRALLGPGTT